MAVIVTVSETVTGGNFADTLAGTGNTGWDVGQATNGQYTPLTLQSANTGHQDLYISHDGVNPITDLKLYIGTFSGSYGGANSAAADFTTLSNYGAADTGATANNSDGFSRGLHIDMSWDVVAASQFAYTREATGQKRIFGKTYSGLDGLSLATAFPLHVDAASYWNGSSEIDATAPVAGQVGPALSTTLGNRGHIRSRFYLNTSATEGGLLQWDTVLAYAYTS